MKETKMRFAKFVTAAVVAPLLTLTMPGRVTGVRAGRRLDDGGFEEGTVHDRANQRLLSLAQTMRAYGAPEGAPETTAEGATEE